MSENTYHQIHFAWAEPTLLGRVGPGPAASSLTESGRPSLRSWRDRLVPALTVDYRSALPGTDPADLPETLWARSYADGQAALVYRWPGDVRDAHAWAVVGPAHGLTLPRILSLHENPNTRPAARRPPVPGWESMPTLEMPTPWELTAAPGAVRTRDRRAAETTVQGEAVLAGAVASALHAPERPIRIALEPGHADLWQATQIRVLWGMHRILHDVLTPARAIPAAGWQWSFSTYDPDLATEGQHLAFGPPRPGADGPYLRTPAPEYRRVAERLVQVLRDEGGDALADHLRERGVPDAPTFGDRRALLADWLDPGADAVVSSVAAVPGGAEELGPGGETAAESLSGEAGPDGGGHGARQHGDTLRAVGSASASDVRGELLPGDGADGDDIPEAEPLPSGEAASGGPDVPAVTGTASPATEPAPEYGRGGPGSGNALDDRGQDAPEDRDSAGPPPEPHGAPGSEGSEAESVPRPGAGPSPAHEEAGPRTKPEREPQDVSAAGARSGRGGASYPYASPLGTRHEAGDPGLRPADDDLSPAPAGPTGGEAVDTDAGERGGSDRPRPHAYSRSVAGAHPSFRLNRPSDEDDGDPLPEVEDLNAPDSAREAHASVEPGRWVRARAATGDGAGEREESTQDAQPEDGASRQPSGGPRPLFGERRPGFAPPAEHPVFGAPEPHDPPSRPTGEPPPLHLPRTPESDLHPRTPDDPTPDPDLADPTESFEPAAPEPRRSDAGTIRVRSGSRRHAEEAFGGPAREESAEDDDTYDTDEDYETDEDGAPHERSPAQAPPLLVAPDGVPAPDYAAETEPETDPDFDDSGANWPTQYADLPLARLERWHAKRGPEGAHTDVVDARAAVRAERSELQRVRDERDHYHAEVQDLRREVARLDRPFLDGDDGPGGTDGGRRWPARLLAVVLLVAFLATGLEAGARFGVGTLDLLSTLPFVP